MPSVFQDVRVNCHHGTPSWLSAPKTPLVPFFRIW